MLSSLVTTKLYFPSARSSLVSRPRLVECLQNGLKGPLTLVSAPAGYGKTTLMSEWRAGVGRSYSVAWLSLDREDNDFPQFLTSIITVLATLEQGFGETTLSLLQSSPPLPDRIILTSLINELAEFGKSFTLILDDYHSITATSIHEAVAYLIDFMPSQMHLVILTRSDPPLPLPRLRARNQLVEIRSADMRFTPEEAGAFLSQVMGLALSKEQVEALEQRTEGWAAGLQLAALSMKGRNDVQGFVSSFSGSHRFIVDYLADEVLKNQPEPVQEFLLKTSILDRLTASLCNALTNRSDGQAALEQLEQTNLFIIPLDDERHWYRYHHLFTDVLRSRLLQVYPDQIPDLYCRAADWLERNSFFEEAFNYSMHNKDFETAARLLSDHRQLILRQRTLSSVLILMKNFPDTIIRGNPRLSLIYAWNLWLSGLRNEAEPYVYNAHQSLLQPSKLAEKMDNIPMFTALFAEATAFRSLVALRQGEMESAIQFAKQAVDVAPSEEYSTQGLAYVSLYNAYRETGRMEDATRACILAIDSTRLGHNLILTVDAIFNLGRILKIQGHLHQAAQVYFDGLAVAESQGQAGLPTYSLIHFGLADIFYQWNNLDETERQLDLGFGLLEHENVLLISRIGHIILAQLKHARGDIHGALQILQEIELEAHTQGTTTFLNEVVAHKAVLQAELGYVADAEGWVKTVESGIDEQLGYQRAVHSIQIAKVFIALGNLDKALDLLSQIDKSAEAGKSISWQIEALILLAKAWHKKGNPGQAFTCLEKALSLAEQEGYVRVFLDEGEPMAILLQHAVKKGVYPAYVRRLLSAASSADKKATLAQPLIEPLSERELEVLRLVAEGMSNGQIADTLIIARGTVKKHINNLFGKLGVQSRTQCVARGRELNLL